MIILVDRSKRKQVYVVVLHLSSINILKSWECAPLEEFLLEFQTWLRAIPLNDGIISVIRFFSFLFCQTQAPQ